MEPWYKVVTPRKEVREGRSFNPDEFAIALEQVVAGTAPPDYREPEKFFARTYFTRALREHTAMVLRRLAGETSTTAPVLSLITQFGGGKTHTLTTLYHLARAGADASRFTGIADVLQAAELAAVPPARVAVFVGNAWDPQPLRETPWLDIARQLAGDAGAAALGTAATTAPPGTESLQRLFDAAGGSVLVLLDEVLNFINRHRDMADHFHAFLHNLTVAMTGTTHSAAVISLPRSQVEMTDWDIQWQEKLTRIVRRVAKDLIALDEAEVSEVIRRRLFEDLGNSTVRSRVAKAFATWCFERRAQLPPEWTAVDTATTEAKSREFLQDRFAACYPFHPATLSVFQRKWQTLPQYQQTRGTLAMLAQWVSWVYRDAFTHARNEPLITLGSAPLDVADLRNVVLGQIGEMRLTAAIDADIAGEMAHARVLDADTKGALRTIHRRVGTAIFFESSGGLAQKVAHLPELRFALGEPDVDTTSIDSAAAALGAKAFYIRQASADGYRVHHKPTLKKVVSDRRASLDAEKEVWPAVRKLVRDEFDRGRSLDLCHDIVDGNDVKDMPRLTLVVLDPSIEWTGDPAVRAQIAEWTKKRNDASRAYPGALVWCVSQRERDIRARVEEWLAWKRVKQEVDRGMLGSDFDKAEHAEIQARMKEIEHEAREKVWGSYRFLLLADKQEADGIRVIDLGAGHASSSDTLCGRVIATLKSHALLNDTVGAGYLERKWPPALKEQGAWPLASLRQSFLNGALTRLLDPDATLKSKIREFVERGDFGLASVQRPDGSYERIWYRETVDAGDIVFESDVYVLLKTTVEALRQKPSGEEPPVPMPVPPLGTDDAGETDRSGTGGGRDKDKDTPSQTNWIDSATGTDEADESVPAPRPQTRTLRISGDIPSEMWNRVGTKLLPKLRSCNDVQVRVEFTLTADGPLAETLPAELEQIFEDLGIAEMLHLDG